MRFLGRFGSDPSLSDALGIHGTLYYDWAEWRSNLPATKREVDWTDTAINAAQRELFRSKR